MSNNATVMSTPEVPTDANDASHAAFPSQALLTFRSLEWGTFELTPGEGPWVFVETDAPLPVGTSVQLSATDLSVSAETTNADTAPSPAHPEEKLGSRQSRSKSRSKRR